MPWLSCCWQKSHTKCSGWNLQPKAEMQRPVMGLAQLPHRVPCRKWKCNEQRGWPSNSMKQPSVKGFKQSWGKKAEKSHERKSCGLMVEAWRVMRNGKRASDGNVVEGERRCRAYRYTHLLFESWFWNPTWRKETFNIIPYISSPCKITLQCNVNLTKCEIVNTPPPNGQQVIVFHLVCCFVSVILCEFEL